MTGAAFVRLFSWIEKHKMGTMSAEVEATGPRKKNQGIPVKQ